MPTLRDPPLDLLPTTPSALSRALRLLGVRRGPALALATEYRIPGEERVVEELIEEMLTMSRRRDGAGPPMRGAHPKQTGCLEAEFTVSDSIPAALRVGLFARPGTYKALLRYSNTAPRVQPDRVTDVRGVAIKVMDICAGGRSLLGDDDQDFLLSSAPALATCDIRDFLALTRADLHSHLLWYFFDPRKRNLWKLGVPLSAPSQSFASPADYRYWSVSAYLLGGGQAVKYAVVPRHPQAISRSDRRADNHLHEDLERQLRGHALTMDFLVQRQLDADAMPIEDLSVRWDERRSPFIKVATIRAPRQELGAALRERADRASFNAWRCLPEHRPLGSVNRARRHIYEALNRERLRRRAERGGNASTRG